MSLVVMGKHSVFGAEAIWNIYVYIHLNSMFYANYQLQVRQLRDKQRLYPVCNKNTQCLWQTHENEKKEKKKQQQRAATIYIIIGRSRTMQNKKENKELYRILFKPYSVTAVCWKSGRCRAFFLHISFVVSDKMNEYVWLRH